MQCSRREFWSRSPGYGSLLVPETPQPPEEWLQQWGMNRQTVLTARRLPLHVLETDSDTNQGQAPLILNGVELFLDHPECFSIPLETGRQSRRHLMAKTALAPFVSSVSARIPTVTGNPGRYRVEAGILGLGNIPFFQLEKTYQPQEALANYLLCLYQKYVDNEVVNVLNAILKLTQSMQVKGIGTGEQFSFLKAAHIRELIDSGQALDGWGLYPNRQGVSEWSIVKAGGICGAVEPLAMMFQQAKINTGVDFRITAEPHTLESARAFLNPEDWQASQFIDASAWYPGKDFLATNPTSRELFIKPAVQVFYLPLEKKPYHGLDTKSLVLVASFTLTTKPVTIEDVQKIKLQLEDLRSVRGI